MNRSETWDFCASEYDTNAEAVTGPCIGKLLEQASVVPVNSTAHPIKVIDLAAGPGILGTLLGNAYSQAGCLEKLTVLSTDFSSKMVEMAERRFKSHNWTPSQFSARTLDATDLAGIPSNYYTHAFCTFGIMMIPDASKALKEMFRVLEPSGTIGITTWHKVGWMPIFFECLARAKMTSAEQEKATPPVPVARNWSETSYVQKVLEDACFQNVQVSTYETPWSFANQNKCVEQLTKSRWLSPMVKDANLTDEQRTRYDQVAPQVVRDLVGKAADQPFDLPMIAIIARGQKPWESFESFCSLKYLKIFLLTSLSVFIAFPFIYSLQFRRNRIFKGFASSEVLMSCLKLWSSSTIILFTHIPLNRRRRIALWIKAMQRSTSSFVFNCIQSQVSKLQYA